MKEDPSMSAEANRALVRRYWEEVWNQGNLAMIEDLFSPQLIEGQKYFVSRTLQAFSHSHVTIEDMIAEGVKVATRYSWQAGHQGGWEVVLKGLAMALAPTVKQRLDR